MPIPPISLSPRRALQLALALLGAVSVLPCLASSAPIGPAGREAPASAEVRDLRYTHLGMEDGLPGSSVYCIHQDRLGYLWFGTFSGLARYDGNYMAVYRPESGRAGSISGSVIFAVEEDGEGHLWIGTDGAGLCLYVREEDSFVVYRAESSSPTAIPSDRIFALAADPSGGLWVGTGGGGLAYRDHHSGSFVRFGGEGTDGFSSSVVRALAVGPGASLWVGTEGGGLARLDRDTGTFHPLALNLRDGAAENTVRALLFDRAGGLWIGTGGGALFYYHDGKVGAVLEAEARAGAVRSLALDKGGRLWVGYEQGGLAVLSADRGFEAEVVARDPSAGKVRALVSDRDGLLWIGAKDGGVRLHDPRSELFRRYLSGIDVRALIEEADSRVLVASDGDGLFRLDPRDGSVEALALPAGMERVYSLLLDRRGRLWVGSDGGGLAVGRPGGPWRRYRHDPDIPESLGSDVIWALYEDSKNKIWVGTEGGGLDLYDEASGSFLHHRSDSMDPRSLLGSSVRTMAEDTRGRLWVGTWDGGLSRLLPEGGGFERYGGPGSALLGIGDSTVNAVFEDSLGRLWLGTASNGLLRFDPAVGATARYGAREGLAGDTVYGIMEDGSGALWVSSAGGLSRFDPGTGAFVNFGEEDGLAGTECSQNSYLLSGAGDLWVGGPAGLSRFRPLDVEPDNRAPGFAITEIEIFGGDGKGGRVIRPTGEPGLLVELGYRNAGLSFRMAVLDYSAPRRNRYEIKLEGLHDEWTSLGSHPQAVLAPLPPGRFVLRAKGAGSNGVWNEAGASFTVLVAPPLWRRPSFYILLAILAGSAVWAAVYARLRALKRRNATLLAFSRHIQEAREEERLRAAREVHDELGQHLVALKLDAHWLVRHPEAREEERGETARRMIGALDEAMESVKSIATRLRPRALDDLDFHEAVSWQIADFRRRTGIACEVRIAEAPPLKRESATALFRVLQEALTNVVRHSGAGAVEIGLGIEGGDLVMEIADDGAGIDPAKAKAEDAFGIIGMRERCRALGGGLEIGPGPRGGTQVTARIPLGENEPR